MLIEMTSGTALAMQEIAVSVGWKSVASFWMPQSAAGTPAAEQGTLTIMVGGDEALLERSALCCKPWEHASCMLEKWARAKL